MHCRSTTSPFLPRPLPPVTVCRHCYLGPWPHRFADARSAAVRETHLGPARDLQPHMCSFAPTLHPHEHDTPHMMPLQVCYAKAVRAHARKAARRAEGGKERERPPSGAAAGGSKRERENEAFGPLARQLVRDKIRVRLRGRVLGLGPPPPPIARTSMLSAPSWWCLSSHHPCPLGLALGWPASNALGTSR